MINKSMFVYLVANVFMIKKLIRKSVIMYRITETYCIKFYRCVILSTFWQIHFQFYACRRSYEPAVFRTWRLERKGLLLEMISSQKKCERDKAKQGVNFTNTLRRPFLYKIVMRHFSLNTVWLCNFLEKVNQRKSYS